MFRLVAVVSLLMLSGCGGGATGGVPVYEVNGKITLGGGPLAFATVAFAPTEKNQPTATGRTDSQGNFILTTYNYGDGAAEGNFKVTVMKSGQATTSGGYGEASETDEHDGDDGSAVEHGKGNKKADQAANLVPDLYSRAKTTPLAAEVTSSGENRFTYDIQ